MAATVTSRNTLDIIFHVADGTAVGSSLTWKFNNPKASISSLSAVRDAFGGASGFLTTQFQTGGSNDPNMKMYICNAAKETIDNVDAARKVQTVTTKEDLG